jgi:hypothetical protein
MDQKMEVEDKMENLVDQKMEQLQNSMEDMLLHTQKVILQSREIMKIRRKKLLNLCHIQRRY